MMLAWAESQQQPNCSTRAALPHALYAPPAEEHGVKRAELPVLLGGWLSSNAEFKKRGGRKKRGAKNPQKPHNNYFWSAQAASTNRSKQIISLLQSKQKLYIIPTILIKKSLKGS